MTTTQRSKIEIGEGILCVASFTFLAIFGVLGFQVYWWLKVGEWLSINLITVAGYIEYELPFSENWAGLDKILLWAYQIWLGWVLLGVSIFIGFLGIKALEYESRVE